MVGGTNPRKAGQTIELNGARTSPVFGTVADTMAATGADVSVVFVPAGAKDAVIEAIDAEIPLLHRDHRGRPGARHGRVLGARERGGQKTSIIGPNCPGVASPGKSNAGIIPADITVPRAGSAWSPSPAR
jgi:succinyl-CoA synthetase alpha subunit